MRMQGHGFLKITRGSGKCFLSSNGRVVGQNCMGGRRRQNKSLFKKVQCLLILEAFPLQGAEVGVWFTEIGIKADGLLEKELGGFFFPF